MAQQNLFPQPFAVKDAITIRDDILRTLRNGLIARGVTNPQLGPGSHEYVLATAVANEIAVASANVQVKADSMMPDTATGSDLDRICAQFGLSRRVAGPSTNFVILSTSANTYIPIGAQLVDISGQRYRVTVGGAYTNTSPTNSIPITAIDAGFATNHVANDVLRWTSTPPYAQPTALVGPAGLTGGCDAEGDESFRARLLSRLQNPPNNCNWSQVAAIAEASHTTIQKAFVYPGVNGPSTVHIIVVQAAQVLTPSITTLSSTSKNRDVDGTVLSGTVKPYIWGQMPEYVETIIETVQNIPNDVSVGLSLPASAAAVPAGPGGGWVDGTPWPNNANSASNFRCMVSAVTSSTAFTVDAPTAPVANVSHICRLDPTTWVLQKALVKTVAGGTGAYVITIDQPFTNVAIGDYIWPGCVNAQVYVDAVLGAFAAMGPGEKTPNIANLTRGYRHPTPVNSWPYTLGAVQLRQVTNAGPEILDVSWLYRTNAGPPSVPVYAFVNGANCISVPRQIAFYPII